MISAYYFVNNFGPLRLIVRLATRCFGYTKVSQHTPSNGLPGQSIFHHPSTQLTWFRQSFNTHQFPLVYEDVYHVIQINCWLSLKNVRCSAINVMMITDHITLIVNQIPIKRTGQPTMLSWRIQSRASTEESACDSSWGTHSSTIIV